MDVGEYIRRKEREKREGEKRRNERKESRTEMSATEAMSKYSSMSEEQLMQELFRVGRVSSGNISAKELDEFYGKVKTFLTPEQAAKDIVRTIPDSKTARPLQFLRTSSSVRFLRRPAKSFLSIAYHSFLPLSRLSGNIVFAKASLCPPTNFPIAVPTPGQIAVPIAASNSGFQLPAVVTSAGKHVACLDPLTPSISATFSCLRNP